MLNKYTYFIVEFSEKGLSEPVEASAIRQVFPNPVHQGEHVAWYDKGKTLNGSISGWVRRVRHCPDYSVLDIETD